MNEQHPPFCSVQDKTVYLKFTPSKLEVCTAALTDGNSKVCPSFEQIREDFNDINSKPLKNFFSFPALQNNLRSLQTVWQNKVFSVFLAFSFFRHFILTRVWRIRLTNLGGIKKTSENWHGRRVSNEIQFLSSLANYALNVFKVLLCPKGSSNTWETSTLWITNLKLEGI